MYTDVKKTRWRAIAAVLAAATLLAGLVFLLGHCADRDLGEESAAAICEAVRRSALQCYAVEGVYPPDLAYLEENYGLQVNTGDFHVTYEAFASNLPPMIRVTDR